MKRARVLWQGAAHFAQPHERGLQLQNGQVLAEDQVSWLPPFIPRSVFAVGLNYADHVKELAFAPQEEPLIFLKGANSLAGHGARSPRPAGDVFMHYECELAVVIGHSARRVPRAAALDYVAGYTVANDYVVREYLENYYRPNLRAKNRDRSTLLGPWLVDAADVPDPQALALRTLVNGTETQRGNTRHMIYSVAFLIEYLSAFMTLSPGDVILTGTPEGVTRVLVGDEVVTEIDGIGRLTNTIEAE
jgi:5-oxopent-3-ene-1,2,5-tricarboxylate decarboxylase/2-hydroxyhepta-2,4-diene-1,7-dioate isomerase